MWTRVPFRPSLPVTLCIFASILSVCWFCIIVMLMTNNVSNQNWSIYKTFRTMYTLHCDPIVRIREQNDTNTWKCENVHLNGLWCVEELMRVVSHVGNSSSVSRKIFKTINKLSPTMNNNTYVYSTADSSNTTRSNGIQYHWIRCIHKSLPVASKVTYGDI